METTDRTRGRSKFRRSGFRCKGLCALALIGLSLSGCLADWNRLTAEEAFARSASALAGYDYFAFDGNVALYAPGGNVEKQSEFRGEVAGHKTAALEWDRENVPAQEKGGHPLSLLKIMQSQAKSVAFAPDSEKGAVALAIQVRPEAATARLKDSIRERMASVREEIESGPAEPGTLPTAGAGNGGRKQAERILAEAEKELEAALSTLKVETECLWTADSKTWFPKRMTETTVLTYALNGKTYTEKRTSVTNFRLDPGGDTMDKQPIF